MTPSDSRKQARKIMASNRPQDGQKYELHHIDGDCFNNDPSNLEWLTIENHLAKHGKILGGQSKESLQKKRKAYDAAHREEHLKRSKCSAEKRKEEIKAYKKEYRETHREQINAYAREWQRQKRKANRNRDGHHS